jgi:hypothetical protein
MAAVAARALGAAGAGMAMVAVGGAVLEAVDTSEAPPFAQSFSGADRWNQTEFVGRFKKMYSSCNPWLLTNDRPSLSQARDEVIAFKARVDAGETDIKLTPDENKALWKNKMLVDMSFNDRGEFIPEPFKLCGIMAFNGPVCVAMLLTKSTAGVLFWAWANQSQNAMMNYYNRGSCGAATAIDVDWDPDLPRLFHELDTDGTGYLDRRNIQQLTTGIMHKELAREKLDLAMERLDPDRNGRVTLEEFTAWFDAFKGDETALAHQLAEQKETESMLQSYGLAVTLALGISFGLSLAINKRFAPERASQLMKFVAFPSTAAASTINCYATLAPSIPSGFPLLDAQGQVVANGETSSKAAEKGVWETVMSRGVLPIPIFLVPPIAMAMIPAIRTAIAANPTLGVPVTCCLTMVSFGFGLPFAVGIFPQIGEIDASEVEIEFRGTKDSRGEAMAKFYYDKGL